MSLRCMSYWAAAAACWAVPAMAQSDQMAMAHTAAANQLGVLEYCQEQGAVGPEAAEAERRSIRRLPASAVDTGAAERLGKQGTIAANGNPMTLANIAGSRNTTVAAICKQMGDAAVQTDAAFASSTTGSSVPGMPGLPPGMVMPGMPAGMPGMPAGMPAMPSGMPSMPGVPSDTGALPGTPAPR